MAAIPDISKYINRFETISQNIICKHLPEQITPFINFFLSIPPSKKGCIVEAGCYKGGGTAKFSIAAKLANRQLVIFDSFQGHPESEQQFKQGSYCGSLDEVKSNVEKYGEIEVCRFIKGWFKDTLPDFSDKICAAFLDVDLSSSTRTCLKYLYPLIIPGGILYSHDGDFAPVIAVYGDDEFWKKEVGCPRPFIEGLGKKKILRIVKKR